MSEIDVLRQRVEKLQEEVGRVEKRARFWCDAAGAKTLEVEHLQQQLADLTTKEAAAMKLAPELEALRAELRFYADTGNWIERAPGYELSSIMDIDGGQRARRALAGEKP